LRSFRPRFFYICATLTLVLSRFVCRRQELEGRARERYSALDRLDAKLSWYQGQYNTLDLLVEALRTPDRWLVYRVEALRDQPPVLDAQAAEDVSAVERVKTTLTDRDEALHKVREDLAWVRTLAPEWEAQVASVRAQLQHDRAALGERVLGRARLKRGLRRRRS
jgi:chromosome segregation ATPase